MHTISIRYTMPTRGVSRIHEAITIKVAVQGLNIQIIHSYMVMLLWLNNYL